MADDDGVIAAARALATAMEPVAGQVHGRALFAGQRSAPLRDEPLERAPTGT